MPRVALVIGSEVGPRGRAKLREWSWVRVDPGFAAVEAMESLKPVLVVVKECQRPVEVVASVRSTSAEAAIVVLASDYDEVEGEAALDAGADCYRDARAQVDEDVIIRAAERVHRRGRSGGGGAPPASSSSLH
jgi:DNA-binding NarL/FixJ family response regulator